jgi:hypothetical protein
MDERPLLDWRPRFDPRSLNFRIELLLAGADPVVRARRWTKPAVLDQGSEGACTGFGTAHALLASPRRWTGVDAEVANLLYRQAQKHDEWPGEDYEGSSVLGAMQATRAAGYIKEYRWAKTMDEILMGVSRFRPLVIGVNWYDGMWEPDDDGFLHATGYIVGGHALLLSGVIPSRRCVVLDNSWGPDWGLRGSAYLSYEDLDRLRREWGEFALPLKPLVRWPAS